MESKCQKIFNEMQYSSDEYQTTHFWVLKEGIVEIHLTTDATFILSVSTESKYVEMEIISFEMLRDNVNELIDALRK